jgi:hypothetical protein
VHQGEITRMDNRNQGCWTKCSLIFLSSLDTSILFDTNRCFHCLPCKCHMQSSRNATHNEQPTGTVCRSRGYPGLQRDCRYPALLHIMNSHQGRYAEVGAIRGYSGIAGIQQCYT